MLKNENWGRGLRVHANIQQLDDLRVSFDCLEYLDLPVDLLLPDWFEYFEDYPLIGLTVEPIVNLGIFTSS